MHDTTAQRTLKVNARDDRLDRLATQLTKPDCSGDTLFTSRGSAGSPFSLVSTSGAIVHDRCVHVTHFDH